MVGPTERIHGYSFPLAGRAFTPSLARDAADSRFVDVASDFSATRSTPSQAGQAACPDEEQLEHDPLHDPALAQSAHVPFLRIRRTTAMNATATNVRITKSIADIQLLFLKTNPSCPKSDVFVTKSEGSYVQAHFAHLPTGVLFAKTGSTRAAKNSFKNAACRRADARACKHVRRAPRRNEPRARTGSRIASQPSRWIAAHSTQLPKRG